MECEEKEYFETNDKETKIKTDQKRFTILFLFIKNIPTLKVQIYQLNLNTAIYCFLL